MSSGGPTPEETSLSSFKLALPFLGAELICDGLVLVILGFLELDVGVIRLSSQKWIRYIALSSIRSDE